MTQFTNSMQNQVKDFHKLFQHPISNTPTLPSLERFTNRKGWGCIEESVEQLFNLSETEEEFNNTIETLHKYLDKAKAKQLAKHKPTPITDENKTDRITALADGLADELYFLLGDCVEAGIDIERVLSIVQDSNLSKLFTDENGNKYAKNDVNGKVIKSSAFFEPEGKIKEEILRQLNK